MPPGDLMFLVLETGKKASNRLVPHSSAFIPTQRAPASGGWMVSTEMYSEACYASPWKLFVHKMFWFFKNSSRGGPETIFLILLLLRSWLLPTEASIYQANAAF